MMNNGSFGPLYNKNQGKIRRNTLVTMLQFRVNKWHFVAFHSQKYGSIPDVLPIDILLL